MKRLLMLAAGLLFAGMANAQYQIQALPILAPLPPTQDDTKTQARVMGDISFTPQMTGPTYGVDLCGIGMRDTGEAHFERSFMFRCGGIGNGYIFEGMIGPNPLFDLRSFAQLNKDGLAVGMAPQDTQPYPIDRVEAHRGDFGCRSFTDADPCGMVWRVAANPKWIWGRIPYMGTGNNMVLLRIAPSGAVAIAISCDYNAVPPAKICTVN